MPDEVVHGRPLEKDEKKVVVTKVYEQGNAVNDEFIQGAYLKASKVQLRKLCYKKKSSSKKKGRGHKLVHLHSSGPRLKENWQEIREKPI